jgi:hypothetical protein
MIKRTNKFQPRAADPFHTFRTHIKYSIWQEELGRLGNRLTIGKDGAFGYQHLCTIARCGMASVNQERISAAFRRRLLRGLAAGRLAF